MQSNNTTGIGRLRQILDNVDRFFDNVSDPRIPHDTLHAESAVVRQEFSASTTIHERNGTTRQEIRTFVPGERVDFISCHANYQNQWINFYTFSNRINMHDRRNGTLWRLSL